jgi:molybdopterin converting factor small subunit
MPPSRDQCSGRPTKALAVRVLALGGARELLGSAEFELPLPAPCLVADFVDRLFESYPRLLPFRGALSIAINGRYAKDTDQVGPGDEVALLPPVAGG